MIIYGRWYGHRFRRPPVVILLPCVTILLPGLSALRTIYEANEHGIMAGFASVYRVLVLIAAILGGAIIGDDLSLIISDHLKSKIGRVMSAMSGRNTIENAQRQVFQEESL